MTLLFNCECEGEGCVECEGAGQINITNYFQSKAYKNRIENRAVKQEYITLEGKEYFVSTVDLCLPPMRWLYPVLLPYETMIFVGGESIYQERYLTREAAVQGHEKMVEQLERGEI